MPRASISTTARPSGRGLPTATGTIGATGCTPPFTAPTASGRCWPSPGGGLVRVTGYETPPNPQMTALGHPGGQAGGVEMLVLDNGAIAKSVHGGLKREPGSINYEVYGTRA